jgi:hypothetical protein
MTQMTCLVYYFTHLVDKHCVVASVAEEFVKIIVNKKKKKEIIMDSNNTFIYYLFIIFLDISSIFFF